MTRLYELTGEYAELQRRAEDGEDVEDALVALTDAVEVKAERVAAILAGLSSGAEALKAEEQRLAARRQSLERQRARLREYLRTCMEQGGITRVKCHAFTLSLRETTELVVVNEDDVEAPFVDIVQERKVARARLREHFRATGEVPAGCDLQTKTSLTVR